MTVAKILEDETLFSIRRNDVGENGIGISFDESLIVHGHICCDRVCILKLDEHPAYNSRFTHNPPPIVDNLVLVQCCESALDMYVIELRKSNGRKPTRRLSAREIQQKFITAFDDFIQSRCESIFSGVVFSKVSAYLVCDPWKLAGKDGCDELFRRKALSSALDAYGSLKPMTFAGRQVLIQPILPPNPLVSAC